MGFHPTPVTDARLALEILAATLTLFTGAIVFAAKLAARPVRILSLGISFE